MVFLYFIHDYNLCSIIIISLFALENNVHCLKRLQLVSTDYFSYWLSLLQCCLLQLQLYTTLLYSYSHTVCVCLIRILYRWHDLTWLKKIIKLQFIERARPSQFIIIIWICVNMLLLIRTIPALNGDMPSPILNGYMGARIANTSILRVHWNKVYVKRRRLCHVVNADL